MCQRKGEPNQEWGHPNGVSVRVQLSSRIIIAGQSVLLHSLAMDLLRDRFSPREYVSHEVPQEELEQIFEAVRWTQSCFNEQPWRFVVARKSDGEFRNRMESLLADGNEFAKEPWVLGIAFGKKTFSHNGKPNKHHGFDTGAACHMIALAAFSRGWNTRFMAGFDFERARDFSTPDFEPWAMFVIGKATPQALLPKPESERNRKAPETYVNWAKRLEK
jgi:nitroreductase